ncbi:MAG: T9SS type A sorting domain-containing protein [Bacteroidetes bacterium]|nr:T9SS type A sorting domain-containing protein [Bacteroidota bacterium]
MNAKKWMLFGLGLVLYTGVSWAQSPTIQWEKSYGGSYDDEGYCIKPTVDGGLVVVGRTSSYDGDCTGDGPWADTTDISVMWIVKTNSSGSIQWQKQLKVTPTANAQLTFGNDIAYSVVQTRDGGYVVAGGGATSDPHSLSLLKLDNNGNKVKEFVIGCNNGTSAYDIKQTFDGGYIVTGQVDAAAHWDSCGVVPHVPPHDPNSGNSTDWWVLKLDGNFGIQWQKTFGGTNDNGNDRSFSVQQTADSGYVICGEAGSWNDDVPTGNSGDQGYSDAWLMKLHGDGSLAWTRTYGGSYYDGASSIVQTTDGGYLIAGFNMSTDGDLSSTGGAMGSWVFKVDALGAIQWQQVLPNGINYNEGYAIQTYDGAYLAVAPMTDNNHTEGGYGLTKIDNLGNILWSKVFGGTNAEKPKSLCQAADGGIVVAGTSFSADGDVTGHHGPADEHTDIWVLKTSSVNTGVQQANSTVSVVVHPNPTQNFLYFSRPTTAQLYDLSGREVLSENDTRQLSLTNLPAGTYFLSLLDKSGNCFQRQTITKQ